MSKKKNENKKKKRGSGKGRKVRKGLSGIRFGLNLLVYTPTFSRERIDLIAKVAEMGYDGVEVPFNDLDVLDAPATRAACEKAGVAMTSCCVLMPDASLCSGESAQRAAGLVSLRRMIDITAEMGGKVMAGPLYAPVRCLTGLARSDDEWNWCVEGLAAAADHARKADITLAIEPLNRFETHVLNTAGDARRMVRAVGSDNLRVQLDTFHGNIEEKDTAAAIRDVGGLLGHFHASESDRGELGTGQVRWKKVFAALKDINYGGWVTIESFATGIVDLCAAACIWRPIYESADRLATDGLAFLKRQAARA